MTTIIMIIIIIQSWQSQSGSNTDYLSLCSRFLRSSHDKQIHKIPQQTGCVNQWTYTHVYVGHVSTCVHHIIGHSKQAMSTSVYYVTKITANWPCQPVSITSLATANWPCQPASITSQRPQQTGHVNRCPLRHEDHSKLAMPASVYYVTKTTANWPCQQVSITSRRPQQTGHVNQCLLRHRDHSKLAMSTSVYYVTETTANWPCQPVSITSQRPQQTSHTN